MSLLSDFALHHRTGNYLLIDDGLTRAFRAVLTAHQTALSPPRRSNHPQHPPHSGRPLRPRLRRPPHRTHAIITSLSQRSAFHASFRPEHWPSAADRPLCTLHNRINTWLHIDLLAAAGGRHKRPASPPPQQSAVLRPARLRTQSRVPRARPRDGDRVRWLGGTALAGEIWRTCGRAGGERCLRGRRRR